MKHRQSIRKATDSLMRIQIEPDIDAIVLNVSEGGFSFRSLKPVSQSGTVHFSFFNNGRRVDASGELAWTDAAMLTGGLSFTSIPPMDREQFLNWVAQSSAKGFAVPGDQATPPQPHWPHPPLTQPPLPQPPPPQVPPPYRPPSDAAAASDVPGPVPNYSPLQSAIPGFALPVDERPPSFSWDREMPYPYPRPSSSFFPGFVTGVIITAIALFVLFLFNGNSADALRDQIRQSAGLSPMPQVAPITTPAPPALPPPAATSPQSTLGAPASPDTNVPPASASLPNAGDNSAAGAAPPTAPPLPSQPPTENQKPDSSTNPPRKAPPPGEDDLALAQRYLATMPGPEGRAKATQYLWSAVEKGNVKAETTLADLYARGDGVTKNCAQARVLLRAAAEKGNAEASNELARLIRTGCS